MTQDWPAEAILTKKRRRALPGVEDVESRLKIGRRGQPLQDREPLPGAEDGGVTLHEDPSVPGVGLVESKPMRGQSQEDPESGDYSWGRRSETQTSL